MQPVYRDVRYRTRGCFSHEAKLITRFFGRSFISFVGFVCWPCYCALPQCALVDRFYDVGAVDSFMRNNRTADQIAAQPYTGNVLDIWRAPTTELWSEQLRCVFAAMLRAPRRVALIPK